MFPSRRSSILISCEEKQNETIDAFYSCLTMECSTLSLLICVAISTYTAILFYVHCMDFFSMPTGCTCSVLLLVGLGGMELHEPYQQWTARQDQTKEAHGPGESGEKRKTLLGVSPVADEVVSETVIIIQRKTDHPLWKVFF